MRWYGFEQEPKDGGTYVYEPDNGISRFVFVYHHSGEDAYADYLAGYGEVDWKYFGSTDDYDHIKNFNIGEKILPNGSYEMFAHDEFGRKGFYKGGKTEFIIDGYGMEVGMLGCGEIFPVNKEGIDVHNHMMTPAPDSIISRNVPVTVNSTGLRVYKDVTDESTQYKILWSKDRETLEELREEVQQLQDNIKDLLEEIDEKVMFS